MNNHIHTQEEKEKYFKDWKKEALFFYRNKMIDENAIERINKLKFKDLKNKIDCDYIINAIKRFRNYKPEVPKCKIVPTQLSLNLSLSDTKTKKNFSIDKETRRKLNDLARHQFIQKTLQQIAFDMTVCKLEKWDYKELPNMLKNEIDNIIAKV